MVDNRRHIHFVTGRLAARSVQQIADQVASKNDFDFSIDVLPITVAALITPKWLLRHIEIPEHATQVILPGHLLPDLDELRGSLSPFPVECGPRDIRDLPLFFGGKRVRDESYGSHRIEILAEINHAPKLSIDELIQQACALADEGADTIDLGCIPGHRWADVGVAVNELVARGLRISIDSFDPWEVTEACKSGASLVLSVNSSNRVNASDWGAEVVAIPDTPSDEKSFQETIEFLSKQSISVRLDPILEPLGCGFVKSLDRFIRCRQTYPDAAMLMGIGNITELTDADSAGINLLLLGICEELGIQSVLTTQVINWARTSVRECDLARRLVHHAYSNHIPPKHMEPDLLLLRDERVNEFDRASIAELATAIRDRDIRILNCDGEIHAVSRGVHVHSPDPFVVMQELSASPIGSGIDASHAFYLGFEMAKALTANTLGKTYTQDESLNWGYLTRPEDHHRLARENRAKK